MSIVDNKFVDPDGNENDQASVTISQGDSVRWTNNGAVQHSVTSTAVPSGAGTFDSGAVNPNGTFTRQFDVVGTYTYRCDFHPGEMFGATVIVE